MAAGGRVRFNVEEVLQQVWEDSDQKEGEVVEEEEVDRQEEVLDNWIETFDGGEECDNEFFRENAKMSLLPLVRQAFLKTSTDSKDLQQVAQNINSRTLSVRSILDQESRLWLSAIHRRLAGKVSTSRPYYAEIARSIPHYVFLSMRQVLRDLNATVPNCYFSGNKKADVISISNNELVYELFSFLSGQTIDGVKKSFARTLTGMTRYNHKVKIIVSASKDFAFVYKKKCGALIVQFYYGEWNLHGNAKHFG